MRLRIGIDFDNTLVSYDGIFHQVAVEKGLIPHETPTSKSAVRDYLRSISQEKAWTELQGYVYGARMDLAAPYPGVDEFFSFCKSHQIETLIISHKTLHPFLGPRYDLHKAARDWLSHHAFSSPAFFELTLKQKLERIQTQRCTLFIDDLPEVFKEEDFPKNVQKILFDPHSHYTESFTTAHSWKDLIPILKQY